MNNLTILALPAENAFKFLLESEQYHNFELPEYFDFDNILNFVKDKVKDRPYSDCLKIQNVGEQKNVNVDILLNKDGKYAVRPITLCNPYLYYFLAREICTPDNWDRINKFFYTCTLPNIISCAMPVVPIKKERFHKAATIQNWWQNIEQRSIELSLEYQYMFVTDIANCYGSVNPQALDWALSCKNTSKQNDENHDIANNLIQLLKDCQHGWNIGIPQGSSLFDIIAEILLSYADLLLYEALNAEGIKNGYYVLRYRDDYRIFCNEKGKLEKISYILQKVLESINFRMNSEKTFISNSVITDSIKKDKLAYILNTPISTKYRCDFDGIQKHALFILLFSRQHPNSGQVRTMLSDLDKRIINRLKPIKSKVSRKSLNDRENSEVKEEKIIEKPGKIHENIKAICAILTQIAIENVNSAHYALRVISRLTDSLKWYLSRREIINKVSNKLISQPNSAYSEIWLQNMTYTRDIKKKKNPYKERLCKLAFGEDVELWNISWLKDELTKDFPQSSAINKDTLNKVTPVITFRETRAYNDDFDEGFDDETCNEVEEILSRH